MECQKRNYLYNSSFSFLRTKKEGKFPSLLSDDASFSQWHLHAQNVDPSQGIQ